MSLPNFGRNKKAATKFVQSKENLTKVFNQTMVALNLKLVFLPNGGVRKADKTKYDAKDFQVVSFWFACFKMLSILHFTVAVASKIKTARIFPTWIFTMHPNVIWDKKARKSLRNIYRFMEREEWDSIPGVLVSLLHKRNSIVVGRLISMQYYAELWFETIGISVYQVGEFLLPGQLKTWIGCDGDGSDSTFINKKKMGETWQTFTHGTIEKYQKEFILPFKPQRKLLIEKIYDKLESTKAGVYDDFLRPNSYHNPEAFILDLDELSNSFSPGSEERKKISTFKKKVRTFGFTMLEPQGRLNKGALWITVREIARVNGISGNDKKILKNLLQLDNISLNGVQGEIPLWILDVFQGYTELHKRTSRFNSFVVADCQSPDDMRIADLLLDIHGLGHVDVIDLKEDEIGMRPRNVKLCLEQGSGTSMGGCSDGTKRLSYIAGKIALMQCFTAINEYGSASYYGMTVTIDKLANDIRGGMLETMMKVSGYPKKVHSLCQGDDAFFANCGPDAALNSLAPRIKMGEAQQIPSYFTALRKDSTQVFAKLTSNGKFNEFWNKLSLKEFTGIPLKARPAKRSKSGSSGGSGYGSDRAIGVVQRCIGLLSFYVHLSMQGQVLEKYKSRLTRDYRDGQIHVVSLIDGIINLLKANSHQHFLEFISANLDPELAKQLTKDYTLLKSAVMDIIEVEEFDFCSDPQVVIEARSTILRLFNLKRRTKEQSETLKAAIHMLLSYQETSG